MQKDRIQRLLPFAGVIFAAVMLAALYLTRGEADASASSQVIFDYWRDHHGVQLVAGLILAPYGAALLLLFTAALRSAICAHESKPACDSPIVLSCGILVACGLTARVAARDAVSL